MSELLIDALRSRNAVAFVGAGFSRQLGLPSFSEVMVRIADDLGFDADLLTSLGEPWTLAEFYQRARNGIGELRSRLDAEWHPSDIDITTSRRHQALVDLDLPLIYTTNWDRWIEAAYDSRGVPCRVVRNVADTRALPTGVTQIVKYHGDFADDSSLVLTESSYFERMSLATPLDVKFVSDVLGRTILFLGYSLADTNIRFLLYRLHRMWEESRFVSARPRSFVVLNRPNVVQESVLQGWGVDSIVLEPEEASDDALADLLQSLRTAAG